MFAIPRVTLIGINRGKNCGIISIHKTVVGNTGVKKNISQEHKKLTALFSVTLQIHFSMK